MYQSEEERDESLEKEKEAGIQLFLTYLIAFFNDRCDSRIISAGVFFRPNNHSMTYLCMCVRVRS